MEAKSAAVRSRQGNGAGRDERDDLPDQLRELLTALQAMKVGDFSARLPGEWTGVMGKVADADFEVANVGWLDFQKLLETFGPMPLPQSRNETHPAGVSINQAAKVAGLDALQTIAARSGYKDRALWSELRVDAPGPRTGLLSLMDQATMTVGDLPPLPAESNGFSASSFDWTRASSLSFALLVLLSLPAYELGFIHHQPQLLLIPLAMFAMVLAGMWWLNESPPRRMQR